MTTAPATATPVRYRGAEAERAVAQLVAATGLAVEARMLHQRGNPGSVDDIARALTVDRGDHVEFLGAGASWPAALGDALWWWPARSRLRRCTDTTHRDLRASIRRVLRGGDVPDPRVAHWMRVRRPHRGRGQIGECVCGVSIAVTQTDGDRAFVAELAAQIAAAHAVAVTGLLGVRNRAPAITAARVELARELRDLGWSFGRIAAALDCHPTAVIYLAKKG